MATTRYRFPTNMSFAPYYYFYYYLLWLLRPRTVLTTATTSRLCAREKHLSHENYDIVRHGNGSRTRYGTPCGAWIRKNYNARRKFQNFFFLISGCCYYFCNPPTKKVLRWGHGRRSLTSNVSKQVRANPIGRSGWGRVPRSIPRRTLRSKAGSLPIRGRGPLGRQRNKTRWVYRRTPSLARSYHNYAVP